MNAVSPREATAAEVEQAAAVYISKADLESGYAAARLARAKEARRQKWRTRSFVGIIACLSAAAAAEGVALAALLPTVRVEPVFVYLRDDGTKITSQSWDDMPADARGAHVYNVLSQYVMLREGWASGTGQRAWDVVSALSTKAVREQFQKEFHRSNPQSPERLYGEKATVRVDVTDVQRDSDRPGAYRVYFNRTLRAADGDMPRENMVATLRVRDVLNPKALPWWQRIQFNAPAIAVWEYPGAVHTTPPGIAAR